MIGLTEGEANMKLRANKQEERAKRKVVKKTNDDAKRRQRQQQAGTTEQLELDQEDFRRRSAKQKTQSVRSLWVAPAGPSMTR